MGGGGGVVVWGGGWGVGWVGGGWFYKRVVPRGGDVVGFLRMGGGGGVGGGFTNVACFQRRAHSQSYSVTHERSKQQHSHHPKLENNTRRRAERYNVLSINPGIFVL